MGFYSLWFSSQGNTALHWAILAKHSCSTSILVNKGKGSDILTMKNSQVTVLLYPCDISNVSDPDPGIVLLIQDPYQDSLWQRKKNFLQKPSYVFKPVPVRRTFRLQKILLTWKKIPFLGDNFCLPGFVAGFPIRVRILWSIWIRIQSGSGSIQLGSWSIQLGSGSIQLGSGSIQSGSRSSQDPDPKHWRQGFSGMGVLQYTVSFASPVSVIKISRFSILAKSLALS